MKTKKILYAAAAAIVLAAVFAASCTGPADLIESVETSVMAANDKFLVISSFSPAAQDLNVNPASDVTIQFDREILTASLPGNVVIETTGGTPFTNWVINYTAGTNTLKLQLTEPFAGNVTYTVKLLRGIRGVDGSELQESKIWSFKTNFLTTGVFWFGQEEDKDNPLVYANAALGNPVPVYINISADSISNVKYWLTDDQSKAYDARTDATWMTVADWDFAANYSLSEGEKTLYLCIRDGDSEENFAYSPPISRTIIVDRTADPPSIPVLAAADDTGSSSSDGITKNTANLTYSGTGEAGAELTLKTGETVLGTTTIASDGTWSVDIERPAGTHSIYAVLTDAAGNPSGDSVSAALNIDATVPAISSVGNTYNGTSQSYLNSGTFTFTAAVSNTASTYTSGIWKVDFYKDTSSTGLTIFAGTDTTSTYTWDWNTSSQAEGTYYIKAVAYDAAGNASATSVNTRYVDKTAPAVSSISNTYSGSDQAYLNLGTFTFTAAVSNTAGGYASPIAKVDFNRETVSTGWTDPPEGTDTTANYTWDWNTSAQGEGNYYINARAYDAAGNESATSANLRYLDKSSPTSPAISSITVPTNAESNYVRGTVTVTGTGSDNRGIDYVRFYIDGVSVGTDSTSAYTYSWNTTASSAGAHTLKTRVYDVAGNYADTIDHTRYVDNTPPSFDLGSTIYKNATHSFAPAITEANLHSSAYLWSGTGVTFGSSTSASTTASCTSDGARTVNLRVRDKAGNDTTDSVTFWWDTTAPTAPASASGTVMAFEQIRWTWTAGSDGGSGLSGNYQYFIDEGAGGTWQATTSTSQVFSNVRFQVGVGIVPDPLYPGTYTINVQERDMAGNWSPSRTYPVTVSSSPILPVPGSSGSKSITVDWPNYYGATWYKLYTGTSSGTYGTPNNLSTSGFSVALPLLTTYYWKYEAYDGTLGSIKATKLYSSPEFIYHATIK